MVDVNATLETSPELVNKDALGAGWFFRLHPDDTDTMHHLLDQSAYERLINDQDHG
ncbi:Glycine cleavage system H protein [compost metagenome]